MNKLFVSLALLASICSSYGSSERTEGLTYSSYASSERAEDLIKPGNNALIIRCDKEPWKSEIG